MYKLSTCTSAKTANPSCQEPKKKTRTKKRRGLEETEEDVFVPPSRQASLTGACLGVDNRSAVCGRQQRELIAGGNRRRDRSRSGSSRTLRTGNRRSERSQSSSTCLRPSGHGAEAEDKACRGIDRPQAAARCSRPVLRNDVPSCPIQMEEEPDHVFISYSHQDVDSMELILDYLNSHHVPTWTDRELTPGTDGWVRAIETALRKAKLILLLCSPASKRSQWVTNEVLLGLDLNKAVLPVVLSGNATKSIPFPIYHVQHIDARRNTLEEHLPKVLGHVLSMRAATSASELSFDQKKLWPSPYRQTDDEECRRRQPPKNIQDIADVSQAINRMKSRLDVRRGEGESSSTGSSIESSGSSTTTSKCWLQGSSVEENCWVLNDGLGEDEALDRALRESQTTVPFSEQIFRAALSFHELAKQKAKIEKAQRSWPQGPPLPRGRLSAQPQR